MLFAGRVQEALLLLTGSQDWAFHQFRLTDDFSCYIADIESVAEVVRSNAGSAEHAVALLCAKNWAFSLGATGLPDISGHVERGDLSLAMEMARLCTGRLDRAERLAAIGVACERMGLSETRDVRDELESVLLDLSDDAIGGKLRSLLKPFVQAGEYERLKTISFEVGGAAPYLTQIATDLLDAGARDAAAEVAEEAARRTLANTYVIARTHSRVELARTLEVLRHAAEVLSEDPGDTLQGPIYLLPIARLLWEEGEQESVIGIVDKLSCPDVWDESGGPTGESCIKGYVELAMDVVGPSAVVEWVSRLKDPAVHVHATTVLAELVDALSRDEAVEILRAELPLSLSLRSYQAQKLAITPCVRALYSMGERELAEQLALCSDLQPRVQQEAMLELAGKMNLEGRHVDCQRFLRSFPKDGLTSSGIARLVIELWSAGARDEALCCLQSSDADTRIEALHELRNGGERSEIEDLLRALDGVEGHEGGRVWTWSDFVVRQALEDTDIGGAWGEGAWVDILETSKAAWEFEEEEESRCVVRWLLGRQMVEEAKVAIDRGFPEDEESGLRDSSAAVSLAEYSLALLEMGRVEEGRAMLFEAMASAWVSYGEWDPVYFWRKCDVGMRVLRAAGESTLRGIVAEMLAIASSVEEGRPEISSWLRGEAAIGLGQAGWSASAQALALRIEPMWVDRVRALCALGGICASTGDGERAAELVGIAEHDCTAIQHQHESQKSFLGLDLSHEPQGFRGLRFVVEVKAELGLLQEAYAIACRMPTGRKRGPMIEVARALALNQNVKGAVALIDALPSTHCSRQGYGDTGPLEARRFISSCLAENGEFLGAVEALGVQPMDELVVCLARNVSLQKEPEAYAGSLRAAIRVASWNEAQYRDLL